MGKFKTDFTKGGRKIIALVGPDSLGGYAGVVELDCPEPLVVGVTWGADGTESEAPEGTYDLVPIPPKTLTAYAVLGKNNGLGLYLDEAAAEDVAERENGQVIKMKGEYYT